MVLTKNGIDEIPLDISASATSQFGPFVFDQTVSSGSLGRRGVVRGVIPATATTPAQLCIAWNDDAGCTPYTASHLPSDLRGETATDVPALMPPQDEAIEMDFVSKNGNSIILNIAKSATALFGEFHFGACIRTAAVPPRRADDDEIPAEGTIGHVRGVFSPKNRTDARIAIQWDADFGVSLYTLDTFRGLAAVDSAPPVATADEGYADTTIHRLRKIPSCLLGGRDVRIILQNVNGPCPLIALSNALILCGRLELQEGATSISVSDLVDELVALLLTAPEPAPPTPDSTTQPAAVAAAADPFEELPEVLSALSTGLDVNVSLLEPTIQSAAHDAVRRIFRPLGVELVHAWVIDPTAEPAVAAVAKEAGGSYDNLVLWICADPEVASDAPDRDAILSKHAASKEAVLEWLNTHMSQQTPFGMAAVFDALPANVPAVLFLNNHFSTVVKVNGALYSLVTDIGFSAEDVRAGAAFEVWDCLVDGKVVPPVVLSGGMNYVTGTLEPSMAARTAADAAQAAAKAENVAYYERLKT